jgi:uncharacterized protein (TIGR00255 family)
MIRSMTGYAFVEHSDDTRELTVEIRSVNNRYLEVYPSMPSFLSPLEPEIRTIVAERASRGKVEIAIRVREFENAPAIHVDAGAVAAARHALDDIARAAGITAEPGYGDILAFEGVMQVERRRDPALYRELLFPVLRKALDQWDRTRLVEGDATGKDIRGHLDRLERAVEVFVSRAEEGEETIIRTVREKFREILGEQVEEQRVLAEAASLALKHGTNEEMSRLKSHLSSVKELLQRGGSIGKRLDFICQEINREVNTTGSKTIFPEVQSAVVESKDAVESIREQVRNIE